MVASTENTREFTTNDSLSQVRCLWEAIFQSDDRILIRPIESWSENGKKKNRTIYKEAGQVSLDRQHEAFWLPRYLKVSERERANLFYGVCPRFGEHEKFDKAWQIRKVPCFWADLDNCDVSEALQRCEAANLPQPSAVVGSGNGVHLYWFLKEPILIDDVGDPPAIEKEWVEIKGKNKPIEYYVDEYDEKVYLNDPKTGKPIRANRPSLSTKATQVQDILAGIAAKIGGDHTTDLSRLLRLSGTMNRKNERNGDTPKPCVLVECEASCRYDIKEFEQFAEQSPSKKKREELSKVRLPPVRTREIGSRLKANLDDLIMGCDLAPAGHRSEPDFRLCCFAIEKGIPKDTIWSEVEHVGKFGERGEDYFDLTWGKAEEAVRSKIHSKQMSKLGFKPESTPDPGLWPSSQSDEGSDVGNHGEEQSPGSDKPVIKIDPVNQPVEELMTEISSVLLAKKFAYARAEQLVLIPDERVLTVTGSGELPGLLSSFVEFKDHGCDGPPKYTPLPDKYAKTWFNRLDELKQFPQINLLTHNPVYGPDWNLVQPGYNPETGIYYMGTPIELATGTHHLDQLLKDFCFKSDPDRANYIGMLLTMLLMPHFIGAKPLALFNGNQPGLGKTILAQIIAVLRGGKTVPTISYNANDEEFEKRLGAAVLAGETSLIIDNAKGKGGANASIDSPCLERSITDETLSYRLLGKSSMIKAENSHIFCLTANSPNVSRDLITRSISINMEYEGDPRKREFTIADPEQYAEDNREKLLGELAGMIESWKAADRPQGDYQSRFDKKDWSKIVGGILDVAGISGFLANSKDADELLDPVRLEIANLVDLIVATSPPRQWGGADMAQLAAEHNILASQLGSVAGRSRDIRMGKLLSRFVDEKFKSANGDQLVLRRATSGNAKRYSVERNVAEC